MQYTIVSGSDLFKLANLVMAKIREGWKPQGGVAAYHPADGTERYMQAMIKESGEVVKTVEARTPTLP
jgi:hypothetical protein